MSDPQEQIKERERNDRVRLADESDEDLGESESGSDDSEYDENGAEVIMLKKVQMRAVRREKRRQKVITYLISMS